MILITPMIDHNYKLLAIHQYHGKYNKPRPNDIFLNSYNKYHTINNTRINGYLNTITFKDNDKIIVLNYSDIDTSLFIEQLRNELTTYIVYIVLNNANDNKIDINFIRKCLKSSNFRIKT